MRSRFVESLFTLLILLCSVNLYGFFDEEGQKKYKKKYEEFWASVPKSYGSLDDFLPVIQKKGWKPNADSIGKKWISGDKVPKFSDYVKIPKELGQDPIPTHVTMFGDFRVFCYGEDTFSITGEKITGFIIKSPSKVDSSFEEKLRKGMSKSFGEAPVSFTRVPFIGTQTQHSQWRVNGLLVDSSFLGISNDYGNLTIKILEDNDPKKVLKPLEYLRFEYEVKQAKADSAEKKFNQVFALNHSHLEVLTEAGLVRGKIKAITEDMVKLEIKVDAYTKLHLELSRPYGALRGKQTVRKNGKILTSTILGTCKTVKKNTGPTK